MLTFEVVLQGRARVLLASGSFTEVCECVEYGWFGFFGQLLDGNYITGRISMIALLRGKMTCKADVHMHRRIHLLDTKDICFY